MNTVLFVNETIGFSENLFLCLRATHILPRCDHRMPVQAQSADNHGMESPSRRSDSDLRVVGSLHGVHVCHSLQHSASLVHVSNSGTSSTGGDS